MPSPRRDNTQPKGTPPAPNEPWSADPVDWKDVGLRRTPQREIVLELVRNCYEHPTADWIHKEARRAIPDISLATVYRTLRILREKGLIYEFSGVRGPSRFDGTAQSHEHVRCVCCGTVVDVDVPEFSDVRQHVARRTGFRIGVSPVLFQGLCPECSARAGRCSGDSGSGDSGSGDSGSGDSGSGDSGGGETEANGASRWADLDRDWAEGPW
jgi:Fe2+ or Zn2+ uptake regulation protein